MEDTFFVSVTGSTCDREFVLNLKAEEMKPNGGSGCRWQRVGITDSVVAVPSGRG